MCRQRGDCQCAAYKGCFAQVFKPALICGLIGKGRIVSMIRFALIMFCFFAGALRAETVEPARGSVTRAALMDALRPHVEWMLGAPVEFVVYDIRANRDAGRAFVSARAQRPGGKAIDLRKTPGFARGEIDPEYMDGSTVQALYMKVGATWVAVHWAVGATDAWYHTTVFCKDYVTVISEACAG